MGKSRGQAPQITPQQVIQQAPTVEPESMGPVNLTDSASQMIQNEVQVAMGNAVAKDLLKDAVEETPEDGALLDLATEAGGGGVATAGPPPGADPTDPTEAQESGARALQTASGGTMLPVVVQEKLEPVFGAAITDVKVHTEESAVEEIDAGAAALGTDVFFAPGRFNPSTPEGLGLIAHELTHAIGEGADGGGLTLGATDSGAESKAEGIQEAVESSLTGEGTGEELPTVAPVGGEGDTIRRGEAGVHQNDITMPAAGVDAPHLNSPNNPNNPRNDTKQMGGFRHRDSENLSPAQRQALQIYAGNFLSDFSQANVPKVVGILGNMPTVDSDGNIATIGAAGAGQVIQTILHAFAVLELGTEAAEMVAASRAQNTEVYTLARHMDNPTGASGQTDFVVANDDGFAAGSTRGGSGDALTTTCVATTAVSPEQQANISSTANSAANITGSSPNTFRPNLTAAVQSDNNDLAVRENAQHEGPATPGQLQYENPSLYRVSPAGLQNHLYNSVEMSKNSYTTAADLGPTPEGRMHVGYGDHIVQDYFSHTNFIEVALNSYVQQMIADGANLHADLTSEHEPHDEHHDEHTIGSGQDHGHQHDNPHDHSNLNAEQKQNARDRLATRLSIDQGTEDREQLVNAQFVSPVFDRVSVDENGNERQAVTTGTFGSTDTLISLAHLLVPVMPKLHASIQQSVDSLLGLINNAGPDSNWTSISESLASSGRDGTALKILMEGLGDAGFRIPVPSGVEFEMGTMPISPGIFGDPWTVPVPTGIDLSYTGVALAPAVDTFIGVYKKVQTLKNGLGRFSRWIGISSVATAIDDAWNAATLAFRNEVQRALSRLQVELVTKITAEVTGAPELTPEQLSNIASGNMADAAAGLEAAVEFAGQTTNMDSRLAAGGDMYDLTTARDNADTNATDTNGDGSVSQEEKDAYIELQRQELERRVGPCTGMGTVDEPWEPVNNMPPSHTEISKDHPPHDPGNHDHLTTSSSHVAQHTDHNPTILNPNADNLSFTGRNERRGDLNHQRSEDNKRRGRVSRDNDGHYPSAQAEGGKLVNQLAPGADLDEDGRMGDSNNDGHGDGHGSSFYNLGVGLAVEAQRHLYKQMEAVWAETTGDENFHLLGDAESSNRRDAGMQVGHDAIQQQAQEASAREGRRAAGQTSIRVPSGGSLTLAQITSAHAPTSIQTNGNMRVDNTASRWTELRDANSSVLPEGVEADTNLTGVAAGQSLQYPAGWLARPTMTHAQSSSQAADRGPALNRMHDLVDLFISHPDDSTWWRTVMDNYVVSNEEEVFNHIRRRNATMANRR